MTPERNARTDGAMLLAICALLYLTGLGDVAFYTRGEPREGNVVREMLSTGDWLVPQRPEGEPARKPALYYWAAALTWSAAPDSPEYALRLPSVLFATAGVVGTWLMTRTLFGAAAAWPAALVLATAFEWTRAAVSARVDMALAGGLTLVFVGWALAIGRGRPSGLWLAALGATLGVLAKGPVAVILPALAIVSFAAVERDFRIVWRVRAPLVLGVAMAVIAAWYTAAIAKEGPEYLTILVRENLLRFVDTEKGRTGHRMPTWYLFAVGAVGFLPWTALVPLGFGYQADDDGRRRVTTFARIWVAVVLMFFSLASAKRSVYLLPLFPALAMLVGVGVSAPPASGRWLQVARGLSWLIPPVLGVFGVIAAAYGAGLDPSQPLLPWLREDDRAGAADMAAITHAHAVPLLGLAIVTVLGALWLARELRAGRWSPLVSGLTALMVAWVMLFDGIFHPEIARGRSVRAFMQRVATAVDRKSVV